MTSIGEPLILPCGVLVRNRLVKSAMSEQLADRKHAPTRELVALYRTWAASGAAILITGNIMVDRHGISEPGQVVLDSSTPSERVRPWTVAGRADGAELWAQLNHAGGQVPRLVRRTARGPGSTAPGRPRLLAQVSPMHSAEIEGLVTRFADSAEIAIACGFTGIQVHAAHGYLISQFLSPATNPRTDDWGGDERRRQAFLRAVLRAIRARIGPNVPLAVKLNSSDFRHDGMTTTAALGAVRAAAEEGVDLIEISGGTFESAAMLGPADIETRQPRDATREAYFDDFLESARQATAVPLMLTGGFRTVAGMSDAVRRGADLIGLARPMILSPHLPLELLRRDDVVAPRRSIGAGRTVFCLPERRSRGTPSNCDALVLDGSPPAHVPPRR